MLHTRLIAKTAPKADAENILFWHSYRISVLGDRLFRMERSENGKFRDCATQAVWFRNMPKQEFAFLDQGEIAYVITPACTLILSKARGQVCVELNGRRVLADNADNLLGTYRTLDNCNGDVRFAPWIKGDKPTKIRLENGVCSKSGVAVFADNSLSLGDDGQVKNERADGTDEYIFAFGDDYRGAVRALYQITGMPPLVPRFALGNWWSRYHVYTDKEYLQLLNGFEEREIPLSVATVDMDWHYSDEHAMKKRLSALKRYSPEYVGTPAVNVGWTGYSWNEELFPDPVDFLQKVKAKGLKVTLNLHPSDGVRFWETAYSKMANAVGADAATERVIPFSFTSDLFINAYFDVLHAPLEKQGVDFWWMDWQQPNIPWLDAGRDEKTESVKKGQAQGADKDYDPLWALNHYHYLDNAKNGKTPLILSRYAGVGSHRYPLGFSGDTEISWATLAYLPYFTATASNVGYTWWSHDIGGHNLGEKNDELYLRHIQYGVFSPVNRLHCSCEETVTKEPWYYGAQGWIAQEFLRFRHKLVPYLYTAAYRTHKDGIALIEPLYYEWKTPQAYAYKTEYLFGGELCIAPVTSRTNADGYARVNAWLPQGIWTDIFTGDEYAIGEGGKELVLLRGSESIPVLIKSGGILPLALDKGNGCLNPKHLEIWSYLGKGEYTLYEDGKEKQKNGELLTSFVADYTKSKGTGTQSLQIIARGDKSVIPDKRVISVRFKNLPKAKIRLFVDGKEYAAEEWLTDCAAVKFVLEVGKTYCVRAEFSLRSKLEKQKARAQKELTLAQGKNAEKLALYRALKKVKSLAEFKAAVENSGLLEAVKKRLLETL